MCKGSRKSDDKKEKQNLKNRTKAKKKRNCCQRCRRKIGKWICKKVKRCVKKQIFGDPDPQFEEFEVAGINLGDIKETLGIGKDSKKSLKKDGKKESIKDDKKEIKKDDFKEMKKDDKKEIKKDEKEITPNPTKSEKKSSVLTLFRKIKRFSLKSIPMKEALKDELDRYSLMQYKGKNLKSIVEDLKERDLVLDLSKDSKLNLRKSEVDQIKQYNAKVKKHKNKLSKDKLDLLANMNVDELKKKFSLSRSKSKILKNMIEEYKKENKLPAVLNKSNIHKKEFSKTEVNHILDDYQAQREDKNFLLIEKIKNISKKISFTGSRVIVLKKMFDDFKNRKFSLSAIPNKSKLNLRDPKKEDLTKILDHYKEHYMKKPRISFTKQSKLKQLKSDIRAKFDY